MAGVYTVTLTVAGPGGSDTPTRANYITATWPERDWRFITTTGMPLVVGEHAMAYDSARGRVVLYGGNATDWPYESATWELDGDDWVTITVAHIPAVRYGAAMAYNSVHSMTVLFGGSDETDDAASDHAWEFDGADWTQVAISGTVPASRTYASLAAGPAGEIYLFGGNDGETHYDDLWRFEDGLWSEISPGGEIPPARSLAALAYDPESGRLLLFGGRSVTGMQLADLWAFDLAAAEWTELDAAGGPPARQASSLTYDPDTGNMVLAGGVAAGGDTLLGDTWHYRAGWIEADPSTPLPPRAYHQIVYDGAGHALILYSHGEVWRYE